MRFAVISDIHGNLTALKEVLDDCELMNIERYFFLGDLALAGPEPSETIDFIREFEKKHLVTIIQGNTDEMIVNYYNTKDDKYLPPNKIMAEALKYVINVLRPDQIEYLASIPPNFEEKMGMLKMLFVHGSPRKNNEDILPNIEPDKLEEIVKDLPHDIIFCGHTHIPAKLGYKNKTILNVGSVGRPLTPEPHMCYAIINYFDFDTKMYTIMHKSLDYKKEEAAEKLRKLPFEGSDKLADMLISPVGRYPQ